MRRLWILVGLALLVGCGLVDKPSTDKAAPADSAAADTTVAQ